MLKGKNKIIIGLMKDKFGDKTMKESATLRAKTYSCLTASNAKDKINKRHKSKS